MRAMVQQALHYLFNVTAWLGSVGWLQFVFILFCGWLAARVARRMMRPLLSRLPNLTAQVLSKSLTCLIWCFAAVQALHAVGVDIMSILGAAGVAGIAIGFASQTALSNLISGIFLTGEQTLHVGDYIHNGSTEGTVEKINMLSVTLRQPDNSCVRIPCETLIKTPVINETAATIRRCAITVSVEYGTDLSRLEAVARRVVQECDFMLADPAPVFRFSGFADSGVELQVCAWCAGNAYYENRYRFAKALYEACNGAGINFAFPVRTIVKKEA